MPCVVYAEVDRPRGRLNRPRPVDRVESAVLTTEIRERTRRGFPYRRPAGRSRNPNLSAKLLPLLAAGSGVERQGEGQRTVTENAQPLLSSIWSGVSIRTNSNAAAMSSATGGGVRTIGRQRCREWRRVGECVASVAREKTYGGEHQKMTLVHGYPEAVGREVSCSSHRSGRRTHSRRAKIRIRGGRLR